MDELEQFDQLKTKVLKYILYKKRTEREIKQKFSEYNDELLTGVIEELKENKYIDDSNYIEKQVNEFLKLKTLSVKEIKYKLLQKGLDNRLIEDYVEQNRDLLEEYEQNCIEKITSKKASNMGEDQLKAYLTRRGFMV